MVQIINISQTRSNLAKIVGAVATSKKPVVVVQNSVPTVIIYPYEPSTIENSFADELLTLSGSWFSGSDYKNMRKAVEKRMSDTNL